MAVFCSVCNKRLLWAGENEGSFQVASGFRGAGGETEIRNTCEPCATVLRQAVTDAANSIVKTEEVAK